MELPSFLLAGNGELLMGRGMAAVLPASPGSLAERITSLLKDNREGVPLLVGALPFDKGRPGWLFQPARLERLPLAEGLRALQQSTTAVLPEHWELSSIPSRNEYVTMVERALSEMTPSGSPDALRKVVLSRTLRLQANRNIDPVALFLRLANDPLANAFAVTVAQGNPVHRPTFTGATPELLIEKRGELVTSFPLAGSAPRSADPVLDQANANALERSEKDQLEHAAVVEWVADHLSPWCRRLRVPARPSLVNTASMWHLGTRIEGVLYHSDTAVVDLAAALHPTPAIAGVPHQRALELIAELEGFDRGYFTGAVGWCDARGDGRWLVAIRCAFLDGPAARLFAGAGIVAGSDPRREAAETGAKFRAMLDALGVTDAERSALELDAA